MNQLPHKIVKKSSKYMTIIAGGVIAFFVMCVIGVYIASNGIGDISLKVREKHIEVLEGYYDAGVYGKMGDYLDSHNLNGATYEKYYRVYSLYDGVEWRKEAIINEAEAIKIIDISVEDVSRTMTYVFEELAEMKSFEEEGFVYDEEEAILSFRENYISTLKEYMLLSDDEIEKAIEVYIEKKNCDDVATLVIERIKSN